VANSTGRSSRGRCPDQLADLDDLRRVEADRRLVEDQDLRVVQQRAGETDTLPVALGKLAHDASAHRPSAQLSTARAVSRPVSARGTPGPRRRGRGIRRRSSRGRAGCSRAGTRGGGGPRGARRRRRSRQPSRCRCRGEVAGEDAHRGGLAGPVGPSKPRISRRATSKETSSTASVRPKRLLTPETRYHQPQPSRASTNPLDPSMARKVPSAISSGRCRKILIFPPLSTPPSRTSRGGNKGMSAAVADASGNGSGRCLAKTGGRGAVLRSRAGRYSPSPKSSST